MSNCKISYEKFEYEKWSGKEISTEFLYILLNIAIKTEDYKMAKLIQDEINSRI